MQADNDVPRVSGGESYELKFINFSLVTTISKFSPEIPYSYFKFDAEYDINIGEPVRATNL